MSHLPKRTKELQPGLVPTLSPKVSEISKWLSSQYCLGPRRQLQETHGALWLLERFFFLFFFCIPPGQKGRPFLERRTAASFSFFSREKQFFFVCPLPMECLATVEENCSLSSHHFALGVWTSAKGRQVHLFTVR